jgi:hypothetical protein
MKIILKKQKTLRKKNITRSNKILGWEGVGNRQLCAFLKRRLIEAC